MADLCHGSNEPVCAINSGHVLVTVCLEGTLSDGFIFWTVFYPTFSCKLNYSCNISTHLSIRDVYLQVAGAGHVITPVSYDWWQSILRTGTGVDSVPSRSWHDTPNLMSWSSTRNSHLQIHT